MTTPSPAPNPNNEQLRKDAIAALQQKTNFWRAVFGWVILSIFMTVIWALSGMGYFWPAWVIVPTLFGLGWMAFNTFSGGSSAPSEAQIQEQMRKMQ